MRDLTIVIPYRDQPAQLARLLGSLPADVPAIVVDDCSDVPPGEIARPHTRLIWRKARGFFSGAVNTGIDACKTDVLVLNQDIWFESDHWLAGLDRLAAEYAIFGDGVFGHPAWPSGYVQGTFMHLRRDAIKVIGGLDERDWPLWGATCEWQLRACRAGYKAMPMNMGQLNWFRHENRTGSRFGAAITDLLRVDPDNKELYLRTPPMVSVIVPCYNYGPYLPDCIASLIGGETCLGHMQGQSYQAFEIIIVDDASTDGVTEGIGRGLADAWKGIRYIRHGENRGCAAAENTGIEAAYGRYIQILSADDMAERDLLLKKLRVMEGDPSLMLYSDVKLFEGTHRTQTWHVKEYNFSELIRKNHVPCGIMFSKAAWRDVGGFPEHFRYGREDWAMAVALGRKGYCGQRIREPLYLYRRDGQNRTKWNTTGEWMTFFRKQMRNTFPDLYNALDNGGTLPMGCCGSKGSVAASSSRSRPTLVEEKMAMAARVGENGMVLVEYGGKNWAKFNLWGAVTGTKYTISAKKRMYYVDARDLPGILAHRESKKPVFRPAPSTVVYPTPAQAPQPVPPMEEAEAPAMAVERESEAEIEPAQCEALTKSGSRCKRPSLDGSKYCKQHQESGA